MIYKCCIISKKKITIIFRLWFSLRRARLIRRSLVFLCIINFREFYGDQLYYRFPSFQTWEFLSFSVLIRWIFFSLLLLIPFHPITKENCCGTTTYWLSAGSIEKSINKLTEKVYRAAKPKINFTFMVLKV